MILAVALNAALDVTYHVDGRVRPHATHRVRAVDATAGGKALNTARVLHGWGEKATVTGLVGGATGAEILGRIPEGLPHAFVTVTGESRRALVVADSVDATGFWEPGPEVTDAEWDRFLIKYRALLKVARLVVLSGSLPRGLAADSYARLVAEARASRVTSILDCDGEALNLALAERPDLVKPNASELAAAVPGVDTSTLDGCREAAHRLRSAGAGAVVASRGSRGLLAVTPDGDLLARPPHVVTGNPTGAGDACVAALARGHVRGRPWRQRLIDAVAASTAAAGAPVAGVVDTEQYLRNRHHVNPEEL